MTKFHFLIVALSILFTSCQAKRLRTLENLDRIAVLKSGILLVRLRDMEDRKEQLIELGYKKKAEEESAAAVANNLSIGKSFKEHFDFCQTAFVYDSDGPQLKAGQFARVRFLDADLQPIQLSDQLLKNYFVADFERSYAESVVTDTADGAQRTAAGSSGVPALVIKDANLIPIPKPFPQVPMLGYQNKGIAKAVDELNQKLHHYLLKSEKAKIKLQLKEKKKNLSS